MSARTGFILALLLLSGVLAAAFVSRNESRRDFIVRQQVGDFDIDAPDLNPPDVEGPDIDGPDIQGPTIDGPEISWFDVVYTALLLLSIIALIIGVILLVRRFGPGGSDETVDARTTRLSQDDQNHPHWEGDEGWAAFDRFCYSLLRDTDPSRAVRIVMRYSENGMGRLEPRMGDETPNEWLRRVQASSPDLAAELEPIVTSYQSVRFAGDGASPAERDSAVNGLRRLARSACDGAPPSTPDPAGSPGGTIS